MSERHLIYFGTEDEMRLGDRILIQKRLQPNLSATVTHIPGKSPAVVGITDHQFGYDCDDGKRCITDFDWLPGLLWSVVPKEIKLVCRCGEDLDPAIQSLDSPEN